MKRKTLRACAALFRIRLTEGLQYRAAAFSSLAIGIFWGIIQCVLYTVFYKYGDNSGNINGMTLSQTITYIWLGQALMIFQAMPIDSEIITKIRNGDVALELCRPLDLYSHWFAKSAAGRLGFGWIRLLLTIVVAFILPIGYRMQAPASLAGFILFLISVVSAFLLCSCYAMLMTTIRMNITWGDGPTLILALMSSVLSGVDLPLRLWPDFMQPFLKLQPFAGFMDIPGQLYVGTILPENAILPIGIQLLWSVIFIITGRIVMNKKMSTMLIQGG